MLLNNNLVKGERSLVLKSIRWGWDWEGVSDMGRIWNKGDMEGCLRLWIYQEQRQDGMGSGEVCVIRKVYVKKLTWKDTKHI